MVPKCQHSGSVSQYGGGPPFPGPVLTNNIDGFYDFVGTINDFMFRNYDLITITETSQFAGRDLTSQLTLRP